MGTSAAAAAVAEGRERGNVDRKKRKERGRRERVHWWGNA